MNKSMTRRSVEEPAGPAREPGHVYAGLIPGVGQVYVACRRCARLLTVDEWFEPCAGLESEIVER